MNETVLQGRVWCEEILSGKVVSDEACERFGKSKPRIPSKSCDATKPCAATPFEALSQEQNASDTAAVQDLKLVNEIDNFINITKFAMPPVMSEFQKQQTRHRKKHPTHYSKQDLDGVHNATMMYRDALTQVQTMINTTRAMPPEELTQMRAAWGTFEKDMENLASDIAKLLEILTLIKEGMEESLQALECLRKHASQSVINNLETLMTDFEAFGKGFMNSVENLIPKFFETIFGISEDTLKIMTQLFEGKELDVDLVIGQMFQAFETLLKLDPGMACLEAVIIRT